MKVCSGSRIATFPVSSAKDARRREHDLLRVVLTHLRPSHPPGEGHEGAVETRRHATAVRSPPQRLCLCGREGVGSATGHARRMAERDRTAVCLLFSAIPSDYRTRISSNQNAASRREIIPTDGSGKCDVMTMRPLSAQASRNAHRVRRAWSGSMSYRKFQSG